MAMHAEGRFLFLEKISTSFLSVQSILATLNNAELIGYTYTALLG